jgi:deoxycytidine triphosphate deaminase
MSDLKTGYWGVIDVKEDNYIIDPYDQESINRSLYRVNLPYALPAKSRILLYTEEHITVPDRCIGVIGVRSTWARLGLVPPTTFARPGWRGHLTLEVFNAGESALQLSPGDIIWEFNIVFAPWEEAYTGRYQDQAAGVSYPKALVRGS